MPRQPESLVMTVNHRDVAVSNPGEGAVSRGRLHQARPRALLPRRVADGALRAAGGRPNVLVRYPNGIGGDFFYQKRAPESRPPWIDVVTLALSSGRTAEEVVPRDAAALAWMANLACLELASASGARRRPRSSRRAARRSRSGPGRRVAADSRRSRRSCARRSTISDSSAGRRRRARAACTSTCAFERRWTFDQVRRAALALAREVERRAPALATSKWWKEERHGVFLDYNQNAKDRTVAAAYSVRPTPGRARLGAADLGRSSTRCDPADFTLATMPARFAAVGDPPRGIDDHAVLARVAARALGASRNGRTRRRALAAALSQAGGRTAARRAVAETRVSKRVAPGTGRTPRPTRPLIEIGRAREKDDALAGLERWRAAIRRPPHILQPSDVLVDAMRGRFRTWTRIRVNLHHVPGRPAARAGTARSRRRHQRLGRDREPDWQRRRPSRARKES